MKTIKGTVKRLTGFFLCKCQHLKKHPIADKPYEIGKYTWSDFELIRIGKLDTCLSVLTGLGAKV